MNRSIRINNCTAYTICKNSLDKMNHYSYFCDTCNQSSSYCFQCNNYLQFYLQSVLFRCNNCKTLKMAKQRETIFKEIETSSIRRYLDNTEIKLDELSINTNANVNVSNQIEDRNVLFDPNSKDMLITQLP